MEPRLYLPRLGQRLRQWFVQPDYPESLGISYSSGPALPVRGGYGAHPLHLKLAICKTIGEIQ